MGIKVWNIYYHGPRWRRKRQWGKILRYCCLHTGTMLGAFHILTYLVLQQSSDIVLPILQMRSTMRKQISQILFRWKYHEMQQLRDFVVILIVCFMIRLILKQNQGVIPIGNKHCFISRMNWNVKLGIKLSDIILVRQIDSIHEILMLVLNLNVMEEFIIIRIIWIDF